MWKQLLDALTQIVTLTQETRQNRADINSLKQEQKEIKLENEMLKFERRLPPGKSENE